jgi:hypothetical protein
VKIWSLYVLGAETNADEPRGDALQKRPTVDELENPGRLNARTAEHPRDDIVLNENLHPLCGTRGEFAPLLYRGQLVIIRPLRLERLRENVGGGDSILNG